MSFSPPQVQNHLVRQMVIRVSISSGGTWLRSEGQTGLLLVLPQCLSAVLTLGQPTESGFGPVEHTHFIGLFQKVLTQDKAAQGTLKST